MKTGDKLTLSIIDVSRGGPGVARHTSGRSVFIPYTLTGDTVLARITEVKRKFANAVIEELIEPSEQRIAPRCAVFGKCGGCQWQHIPYSMQWQIKLAGIRQALRVNDVSISATIEEFPAQQQWNYRNRIQLRGLRHQLGYYAPRSHTIIAIDQCDIAAPQINQALASIMQEGAQSKRPYKVEIALTADNRIQTFWNARHAAGGFRQVNDEQNQKLKHWVASQLKHTTAILDLYGGSANLSWDIAAQGAKVHCVDISVPEPIPRNTPPGLQFHRSDVLPWLKQIITEIKFKRAPEPDTPYAAIIDPPRGGLGDDFEEIIERLEYLQVNEIIAVGCKTDTWARDVARLQARDWKLKKVAAFDFFPQTVHVETTAHLYRTL